jgi:hypothetical protein
MVEQGEVSGGQMGSRSDSSDHNRSPPTEVAPVTD